MVDLGDLAKQTSDILKSSSLLKQAIGKCVKRMVLLSLNNGTYEMFFAFMDLNYEYAFSESIVFTAKGGNYTFEL